MPKTIEKPLAKTTMNFFQFRHRAIVATASNCELLGKFGQVFFSVSYSSGDLLASGVEHNQVRRFLRIKFERCHVEQVRADESFNLGNEFVRPFPVILIRAQIFLFHFRTVQIRRASLLKKSLIAAQGLLV